MLLIRAPTFDRRGGTPEGIASRIIFFSLWLTKVSFHGRWFCWHDSLQGALTGLPNEISHRLAVFRNVNSLYSVVIPRIELCLCICTHVRTLTFHPGVHTRV